MSLRGPYYKQLLKSHLLVILVPLLIMCMLLYRGMRTLSTEIRQGQLALMTQSSEYITRRLNEVDRQLQTMLKDEKIQRLSEGVDETDCLAALTVYTDYATGLDSLAVLPQNSPSLLYTSDGPQPQDTLLTEQWKLTAQETASWRTYISDHRSHLNYFRDSGILMRIVPFPQGGCLIAVLSGDLMSELDSALDATSAGAALVLCGSDGQPLYAVDRNGLLLTSGLREAAFAAVSDESFLYQGTRYWDLAVTIEGTSWKLLVILPNAVLRSRMHSASQFLLVSGTVLLAVCLALAVTRRQYRPIQHLSSMAMLGEDDQSSNELESISSRLDVTRTLSQTALVQRRMLMESTIFRLIQGHSMGWDDALHAMRTLNMLSDAKVLTVIRIRMFTTPQPISHDALLDYIHARYSRQDRAYAIEMALNGEPAVAMVVKLLSAVPEEEIKAVVNDLSIFVRHQMKVGCFFGVGSIVPMDQLPTSCIEASIALEHPMDADAQQIIRFSDLSNVTLEIDPQFQRMTMLYVHGLKNAGESSPQPLLEELLEYLDSCAGRSLWQFYSFSFAEALVQLLNDERSTRFRQAADSPNISTILTIALSTSNPKEYDELIRQAAQLMLDASLAWDAQQASDTQGRVRRWLDDNLTNPLLSLEMMTVDFGFSSTYWSRYFSEQIGTPFNELVWRRRCALFKEQLVATSRPIKALVNEVGYLDVSSFSRRFKLEEGLTPGQWRQLYQKNEKVEKDANNK